MSGLPTGAVATGAATGAVATGAVTTGVATGAVATGAVATGAVATGAATSLQTSLPTGAVATGAATSLQTSLPTGAVATGATTRSVTPPPIYITLSGPVPSGPIGVPVDYTADDGLGPDPQVIRDPNLYPYYFNDGFVLHNESTLASMTVPELINYSTAISTSIGLEQSTITANQQSINQYTVLISQSDAIISALDNEIFTCEVTYANSNAYLSSLIEEDASYDSTISSLNQQITDNSNNLIEIEAEIRERERESGEYDSTLAKEWDSYTASTITYTTLNSIYQAKKRYYEETVERMSTIDGNISTAYAEEEVSYRVMKKTASDWQTADAALTTLMDESTMIRSEVVRCRTRIAKAIQDYESTCVAASSLSTLSRAEHINYEYALSLSTLAHIAEEYTTADSNFTTADIAYKNSLPTGGQGGGGDQTLFTIRSMAQQNLYQVSTQMLGVKKATDTLQSLAGISQTHAYASMLVQYQENINSSTRRINTLKGIEERSRREVMHWSTIYDNASLKKREYTEILREVSSLYISSVEGNETAIKKNREIDTDYNTQMETYKTNSYTLSSLRAERASSMSSLDGWLEISSMKLRELETAVEELKEVRTKYDRSEILIRQYTDTVQKKRQEQEVNKTQLFIESSLLKKYEIELEEYLTETLDSLNSQEWSAYEYRQTFCQELGVNYQQKYHSLVLGAVQYASTQNGLNAAFGGAPVEPIPINLNTVQLSNAYLTLTNIKTFITSFDTLFTQFNKQSSNIAMMSTAVGYEYIYWENFQESSITLLSENTPYVQELVSTSLGVFESSAQVFSDASGVVYSQIRTIGQIKEKVSETYSTFFTPAQIAAQDEVISSFIIKGMEKASTLIGDLILEEPIQIMGASNVSGSQPSGP